ncbi:MAG TPA: hypothetical protein VK781_01395 [Solirubrobacteraceae bacterium]|jgi:hypothetical protein|nr:hypothetical protein [Solirubrobacteraceae bacterium]
MNSPILPVPGPLGYPNTASPAPTGVIDGVALPSDPAVSERTLSSGACSSTPPAGVLEEIAAAGRTSEELRASGRIVRFARDEQSGRVTVELRGREGNMLRALSIAETLDIAAGKPLG